MAYAHQRLVRATLPSPPNDPIQGLSGLTDPRRRQVADAPQRAWGPTRGQPLAAWGEDPTAAWGGQLESLLEVARRQLGADGGWPPRAWGARGADGGELGADRQGPRGQERWSAWCW